MTQAVNSGIFDHIERQFTNSCLRILRFLIFPVGISCMVVAGYFLIQGFLQIGGDNTTKNAWIILGILFQIGESICFVSAAAFTNHSMLWRYSAIGFGVLLFIMSIGVMTLAQKTAMFAGETHATAVDQQRKNIQSQLDSLDELIASFRLNAEKQSQSIYAQSRALGQDSLIKAAELEEKKLLLTDKLYALTSSRKQTSKDFFSTLEGAYGYDAQKTEFSFFVARSLLIEGLGIFLMALGAHQYSRNYRETTYRTVFSNETSRKEQDMLNDRADPSADPVGSGLDRRSANPTQLGSVPTDPVMLAHVKDDESDPTGLPLPTDADIFNEPEPMDIDTKEMIEKVENALSKPNKYWADSKVRQLRESRIDSEGIDEKQELDQLVTLICRLYEEGEINSVGRDSVRKTINEHYGKSIGSRKAMEISRLVKQRLSMTPA